MYLTEPMLTPEEDGLLSGTPTPENLMRLGASLPSVSPQLLIGAEPESAFAHAAAGMLAGAAAAAGGRCLLVPNATLPELSAASLAANVPLLLHVAEHRLRIYARGLLPLTAAQQDILLHQPHPAWLAPAQYGEVETAQGLTALFPTRILERLPAQFTVLPEISTGSAPLYRLMTRLLRGGRGAMLTMQLSADGRRLSVYGEECGWIFHEKLLLLNCQQRFAAGEDVALPYWMPHAAENMAAQYGRRVLRYASASDGTDGEARALALRQGFTLDATLLCADFLRMLATCGMSLEQWLESIPACHTVRRIVKLEGDTSSEAEDNPLHRWQQQSHAAATAEGYLAEESRGRALVRPSRSGRTVTLLAEAATMEAASELAGDISSLLGH